jgi:predicted transcriptional regulator
MTRNRLEQAETLTFRIAPELKAAFAEIAEAEAKPIGELLRELIRQRVAEQRRREFEAEARRQSLEAAAAACDPESDEAQIMRELDANLAEGVYGWK